MTNEYSVVPVNSGHVIELSRTMRKADIEEVWASSRRRPKESLDYSILVSRDARAGIINGEVACIFGVGIQEGTALTGDRARPWLLGSDLLPKHARAFLRISREYVNEISQEYPVLENYVDARNEQSIRWLRWLGFDIKDAIPFGPDQLPFHPFEKRA